MDAIYNKILSTTALKSPQRPAAIETPREPYESPRQERPPVILKRKFIARRTR